MHQQTASAWRNDSQAATGGVGILINPTVEKVLCDISRISERVLKATFAGNPETTIIVAYSPINVSKNTKQTEAFFNHLRQAIDSTPPHNCLMILGDFNAKISAAHLKFAHEKKTNQNGQCLLHLVNEKSLLITNTSFEKGWESDGPLKTQEKIEISFITYW